MLLFFFFFFFSSRRRHTRSYGDWSSDVCSSDLQTLLPPTPQNRAVAVELMTVTFRNRTRSSALSAVGMARFSFRSPRRAHVGRERWPLARIALRGSERARNECIGLMMRAQGTGKLSR